MSRKLLQLCMGVLGLVPTLTGLIGLLGVYDPIYAALGLPRDPLLDSNMRFYSGVWLGLGLAILATLPRIEQHAGLYRILWAMIFLGGLGRLAALFSTGLPPLPFIGFIALELAGAPLFVCWHGRVARGAEAARG